MDSLEKGNKSDEEEVDPRIQGELEKLNQSTDDINRWEMELEDGRQRFRAVLVEATVKLDELVKKIGKAVEESKPYWEARRAARQAQLEAQRATHDFQRATEVLLAAKETIALAEERLLEVDSRQFNSAWQEMLNHATQRVTEADQTKTHSELVHRETAASYNAAISHMKQLEKKLKRSVNKSRPYFDLKAKYCLQLEQLKNQVDERQAKLALAKAEYRTALRNLEAISDEIHERRRSSATRPHTGDADSDSGSADDIAAFRRESDGISMTSETFEDERFNSGASEDSETQSACGLTFGPGPIDLPCPGSSSPLPSSHPGGPELPQGVAPVSPVLGPRSQCSGASSPDWLLQRGDRAEGAEGRAPCSNTKQSAHLESHMGTLSLQHPEGEDPGRFAMAPDPEGEDPGRFAVAPDPEGEDPGRFAVAPDPEGEDPGRFAVAPDPEGEDPGRFAVAPDPAPAALLATGM